METINNTFWDLCENPPANIDWEDVDWVSNLFEWALSWKAAEGTAFDLYLDLIGYSHFFKGNARQVLEYLEIDELKDALDEYKANPKAVKDWIRLIMQTEQGKRYRERLTEEENN